MERNQIRAFDEAFLTPLCPLDVATAGLDKYVAQAKDDIKKRKTLEALIGNLDLTTLSAVDTPEKVKALTDRAINPVKDNETVHCAAVCIYPIRVVDVCAQLSARNARGKVQVASVAGGFPTGMYRLESRLKEIELACVDGATEIDTVINRPAALVGDWKLVYDELVAMRRQCGDAHLKTILAVGELGSAENVYKASMCAMMAGSDFIKTSTGKEATNATFESAYIMCTAARHYRERTGMKVGFKPAGGISTPEQAQAYKNIVASILGDECTSPQLFRIGASSLLDNILKAM